MIRGGLARTLLVLNLAVSGTLVSIAPAGAGGFSCTYDSTTKTVTATVSANLDRVKIFREQAEIKARGTDCGAATRFNTDKVILNDLAARNLDVWLDLTGGRFRPGFTDEPGSSDEIEFAVNLREGPWQEVLLVYGTEVTDSFRVGTFVLPNGPQRRVNLNANETTGIDHDVVVRGPSVFMDLLGSGGNDVLGGTGGAGTGGVYQDKMGFNAGDGADRLRGGNGRNFMGGGPGPDLVVGGRRGDSAGGGGGDDTVRTGRRRDFLTGFGGDDELLAGPGEDECWDTRGNNNFESCETINEF